MLPAQAQREWSSLQGGSDCLPSLGASSWGIFVFSEPPHAGWAVAVTDLPKSGLLESPQQGDSSCYRKIKQLRFSQGAHRNLKGQDLIYKASRGSRLFQVSACTSPKLCLMTQRI